MTSLMDCWPFMFSTEPLMFLTVTEKTTMFNSQLENIFRNAKFSSVLDFERLNVKRIEKAT